MKNAHARERQAAIATEIVRSVKFDYFDSKVSRTSAFSHARAEGISRARVEHGLGFEGRYMRVPRLYRQDLRPKMVEAFDLIADTHDQPFIHSDNHVVVAGVTNPKANGPRGRDPGLVIPHHGNSSFLRIPISNLAHVAMIPPLNIARHPNEDPVTNQDIIEVKLGRNILVGEERDKDIDRAVRDSYRPFETVLAVGEDAVRAYVDAVQNAAEVYAPRIDSDLGRAEAVSQVYEAMKNF